MNKSDRRLFLRQLLLFGSGCFIGSKLGSFTLVSKSRSGEGQFFANLPRMLNNDRIACVGLDFTGAHSAAHLLTSYGSVNGSCRMLHNFQVGKWRDLRRNHESVSFLESELKKQRPGEKYIVSIRIRPTGFDEMVEFLEKNGFQTYLFEPRSYENASMNRMYFLQLGLLSLKLNEFRPEVLPFKPYDHRYLPEFTQSWNLYFSAKSKLSGATVVHFDEHAYQKSIRRYLPQGEVWREPFLDHPEDKLLMNAPVITKA